MFEKIKPLDSSSVEDAVRLWADNLNNNGYYQEYFNQINVGDDLYIEFREDIKYIIHSGLCYGLYKKGVLMSVLLSIDTWKLHNEDEVKFNSIFGTSTPYLKTLSEYVLSKGPNTIFITAIVTRKQRRTRHYAVKLLQFFDKKIPAGYTVITDCADGLERLWERFSYQLMRLECEDKLIISVKEY